MSRPLSHFLESSGDEQSKQMLPDQTFPTISRTTRDSFSPQGTLTMEKQSNTQSHAGSVRGLDSTANEQLLQALRGLQFGHVTLIVQDGVIVQIDRLEKSRIRRRTAG